MYIYNSLTTNKDNKIEQKQKKCSETSQQWTFQIEDMPWIADKMFSPKYVNLPFPTKGESNPRSYYYYYHYYYYY